MLVYMGQQFQASMHSRLIYPRIAFCNIQLTIVVSINLKNSQGDTALKSLGEKLGNQRWQPRNG